MNPTRLILLSAALLLAMGCGKKDTLTSTTSEGDKVKVTTKGDKSRLEITSKSGEKTVLNVGAGGVELPAGFPKDLPLFPKHAVQASHQNGQDIIVHVVAQAPWTEVAKYYETELKSQGWDIEQNTTMGEGAMISTAKGKVKCMLMFAKADDKSTNVQFMLSPKDE